MCYTHPCPVLIAILKVSCDEVRRVCLDRIRIVRAASHLVTQIELAATRHDPGDTACPAISVKLYMIVVPISVIVRAIFAGPMVSYERGLLKLYVF